MDLSKMSIGTYLKKLKSNDYFQFHGVENGNYVLRHLKLHPQHDLTIRIHKDDHNELKNYTVIEHLPDNYVPF